MRELQNVLRNIVVLHDGEAVELEMLPAELRGSADSPPFAEQGAGIASRRQNGAAPAPVLPTANGRGKIMPPRLRDPHHHRECHHGLQRQHSARRDGIEDQPIYALYAYKAGRRTLPPRRGSRIRRIPPDRTRGRPQHGMMRRQEPPRPDPTVCGLPNALRASDLITSSGRARETSIE